MPQIDNLASSYGERGFLVLGINIGESLSVVQSYQDQYPNILFLRDIYGTVFNQYKKSGGGIPLNYLIDHDARQTIDYSMEGFNLFLIQGRMIGLLCDIGLILTPDAASYPRGTSLGFDLDYRNWKSNQSVFYRIIDVRLPSSAYFQLYPPLQITLGPDEARTVRYDKPLPAQVPLGNYVMRARAGLPGALWNADFFMFEIIP